MSLKQPVATIGERLFHLFGRLRDVLQKREICCWGDKILAQPFRKLLVNRFGAGAVFGKYFKTLCVPPEQGLLR